MKVDLNSPVDDFHQRIPNMAHEVCVCWQIAVLFPDFPPQDEVESLVLNLW